MQADTREARINGFGQKHRAREHGAKQLGHIQNRSMLYTYVVVHTPNRWLYVLLATA